MAKKSSVMYKTTNKPTNTITISKLEYNLLWALVYMTAITYILKKFC